MWHTAMCTIAGCVRVWWSWVCTSVVELGVCTCRLFVASLHNRLFEGMQTLQRPIPVQVQHLCKYSPRLIATKQMRYTLQALLAKNARLRIPSTLTVRYTKKPPTLAVYLHTITPSATIISTNQQYTHTHSTPSVYKGVHSVPACHSRSTRSLRPIGTACSQSKSTSLRSSSRRPRNHETNGHRAVNLTCSHPTPCLVYVYA